MSSVTDIIEDFILSTMAKDNEIELSRNDLAKYFACVPSQINYVLNTRFTINRGFVIESARGGAGYIKVIKVQSKGNNYFKALLEMCDKPISLNEGCQILDNMEANNYLTERESLIIKHSISAKSLTNPINMEDTIRANMLKEIIKTLMK